MRKLSKSLFTIGLIFGAAYVLAASGCADSGGGTPAVAAPNSDGLDLWQTNLEPIPASQVRECSGNEYVALMSLKNAVDKANVQVDKSKGAKLPAAIETSLNAINLCDSRLSYHFEEPCKKTKQTVINTQVKVYDAYSIRSDCRKVDGYLRKHDVRPAFNSGSPVTPPPSQPNPQPLPVEPAPVNPPPVIDDNSSSGLAMCSDEEFTRLKTWSGWLDKSNISLKKMGSNWKFDQVAVDNTTQATKACDILMPYHEKRPCQKKIKQADGSFLNKLYTKETITERCHVARTYFYEYVQNKETLIWQNAELYLDLSRLESKRFEPDSFTSIFGCVAENKTKNVIDYSDRKARVIETRGFEEKQPVFITAEGLHFVCYGVDLDGPFSKRQVVNLLQSEGVNVQLEYILK